MEVILPRYQEETLPRPQTSVYNEVPEGMTERYLPVESIVLQHVTQCDRFPDLDSIYVHGEFHTMVMPPDAPVYNEYEDWFDRDGLPESLDSPKRSVFPSYSGAYLVQEKSTGLNEIQVCKVASHLLEAMVYLLDMRIVHDDLSHRNYLVDEHLNVGIFAIMLPPLFSTSSSKHSF